MVEASYDKNADSAENNLCSECQNMIFFDPNDLIFLDQSYYSDQRVVIDHLQVVMHHLGAKKGESKVMRVQKFCQRVFGHLG